MSSITVRAISRSGRSRDCSGPCRNR